MRPDVYSTRHPQIYEATYQHGRRKRRHRCRRCARILAAGEAVLMVRRDRGTYAAHVACADAPSPTGFTLRMAFEEMAWQREQRLRGVPYREQTNLYPPRADQPEHSL